jgi:protein gp37
VTIREVVTPEQVTAAMQEHRTHVLRDVVQRRWPLPNVWLGVSVEDQAAADERIPALLDTPAAVRSLSCEPLLEPVDLEPWLRRVATSGPGWRMTGGSAMAIADIVLDWVIVGGESGPGARPCDVGWIRDIVGQCRAAEVPVFVKQAGSKPYDDISLTDGRFLARLRLRDRAGRDMSEWPEDLRVREWPS